MPRFPRRRVDPGLLGQNRRPGWPADEPLRMLAIGGEQGLLPGLNQLLGQPVVNDSRRHQADPRMTVLGVVVVEEAAAEASGVLDGAETIGELRAVLHRLELRLGVRIVVGHVRPRVALEHAQVSQQQGHRLAAHRRTAVRVDRELVWRDPLLAAARGDQTAGQRGTLPVGHHPAGHVATEDVEDHVQVEVRPLDRATQLGDVPRPDLVGALGEQLGLVAALLETARESDGDRLRCKNCGSFIPGVSKLKLGDILAVIRELRAILPAQHKYEGLPPIQVNVVAGGPVVPYSREQGR